MNSHYWFFHIYFSHYIKYQTADFQREIFTITENEQNKLAVIVAFRGSAKSTIASLSFPIWAMLGKLQKKFIIITSLTSNQSRLLLTAIKNELETNELLINDFGPFDEDDQEWRSNSLVIRKYGTRISSFSTGEAIRGSKHNQYRPDLIICDDIEDLSSVKTKESRDKTHQWLTGEVIPAGDTNTKVAVVGNLLHEDSVICRLDENINEGILNGVFRKYPLLDEHETPLWPGKFPDQQSIRNLQSQVANDQAWHREYLLHIISDAERVIHPEWIQYYDRLPGKSNPTGFQFIATGVDLAISQKHYADNTAMVSVQTHRIGSKYMFYILPNPINQKLSFPDTEQMLKDISMLLDSYLYIEEVGYQASIIQDLTQDGYHATGVSPKSQDKRTRLSLISHLVKNGTILFPKFGCEDLIKQMVGFGIEKHDDLVDALTTLILGIIGKPPYTGEVRSVPIENFYNSRTISSRHGDWAEEEDRRIFRKLKFRNHHRIYG